MRDLLPLCLALGLLTAATAWRAEGRRGALDAPAPRAPVEADPLRAATVEADPGTIRLNPDSLRIAAAARAALDRPPRGYRNDCSGYVTGALHAVDRVQPLGLPHAARVADWWAYAEANDLVHHNPIPVVGDLAFFDNTFDRDGNGRMDDARTHIAIVVDVEPDGTVVLAHKGSSYALIRMNLLHPTEKEGPDGVLWNTFLRRTGDRGNPLGMYRTATLWTAFATLPPADVSERR